MLRFEKNVRRSPYECIAVIKANRICNRAAPPPLGDTASANTAGYFFFLLILLGKDTGENQTLLLELVPQRSTLLHLSSFHDSPAGLSEKQRRAIGLFPLTVPPRSALPPVRFFAKLSPIQMVLYVYII